MKRPWLWVLLLILVLALGAELTYYFGWYKNIMAWVKPASVITNQTANLVSEIKPNESVVKSGQMVSDPGVTWITPKKLEDLKLTITPATNDGIEVGNTYYKIADLIGGGELILDVYQPDCPCRPELLRFKKVGNVYTYLVKQSAEKDINVISQIIKPEIANDYSTSYQSISAPDFLTVNGTTLKSGNTVGLFSEISSGAKEVGDTDYGKLYRTSVVQNSNGVAGVNYSLRLVDSTYLTYVIKFPFQTDDEIALITWSDGMANKDKFTAEGYTRCGMVASDNAILDTTNIETRLKIAGKTNTGDNIYTVSASDAVAKAAYENYTTGRDKNILTIDQFVAEKTLFVWKSSIGDYIVFTNRNYGGLTECGKPVVYLYPEQETEVTVKIDAKISKSDPTYNNGWKVLAKPSGELIVGDKTYSSLFWEGQGIEYPIVNEGTIVKQADIEATLRSQMKLLGLNEKEAQDFLDFWLTKMPKTPYIRLTWFGTKEMNKLAPMAVNPVPNTVIRIFLDFEGLKEFSVIKPQILKSIPRKGFTLIEWGGLLR
jgi:hypothetical protein